MNLKLLSMTLFGASRGKPKGILREEKRCIVSIQILKCCEKEIKIGEMLILDNYNGFDARKIYKGKCSVCGDDVVFLFQRRIEDGKEFGTMLNNIEAVKALYREKRRIKACIPFIQSKTVQNWIYGTNVEIKNKKGQVIKIKQYSTDYKSGKRKLEKEIVCI